MATEIQKLKELTYNTTITLGVIQQDNDLLEIFSEQIKMPFNILFRLSEEGILNERTKELLTNIFEKLILTKKDLIDKYLRLADTNGVVVSSIKEIPIEVEEEDFEEEEENLTPIIVDTEKVEKKAKQKKEKTGKELPRRYGKEKIAQDIAKQGGNATPVQRAMLKVNDLKNIYVNLSSRGIKDMLGDANLLSDEDCRKIISVITIAERQLEDILKKKK
jgi:hypothetical protein